MLDRCSVHGEVDVACACGVAVGVGRSIFKRLRSSACAMQGGGINVNFLVMRQQSCARQRSAIWWYLPFECAGSSRERSPSRLVCRMAGAARLAAEPNWARLPSPIGLFTNKAFLPEAATSLSL